MEFNFKVVPSAESLYKNGTEFQAAASRCLGMTENGIIEIVKDGSFTMLAAPAVVNATFSCEMYLKALLLKSGQDYPTDRDGHNLKKLYAILPKGIRRELYRYCVQKNDDAETVFEVFLERHSLDFVNTRYYVTREGWQGMSPIEVYTYAYNLGNITRHLLLNWENVQWQD